MTSDLEARVWDCLKTITFPGMSRDIVSFGFVDSVAVEDGAVEIGLAITTHNEQVGEEVRQQVEQA